MMSLVVHTIYFLIRLFQLISQKVKIRNKMIFHKCRKIRYQYSLKQSERSDHEDIKEEHPAFDENRIYKFKINLMT